MDTKEKAGLLASRKATASRFDERNEIRGYLNRLDANKGYKTLRDDFTYSEYRTMVQLFTQGTLGAYAHDGPYSKRDAAKILQHQNLSGDLIEKIASYDLLFTGGMTGDSIFNLVVHHKNATNRSKYYAFRGYAAYHASFSSAYLTAGETTMWDLFNNKYGKFFEERELETLRIFCCDSYRSSARRLTKAQRLEALYQHVNRVKKFDDDTWALYKTLLDDANALEVSQDMQQKLGKLAALTMRGNKTNKGGVK